MYQIYTQNVPNVLKMFQMAIKYINIFKSEALQNLPKLGFFGMKTNHPATLLLSRADLRNDSLMMAPRFAGSSRFSY
jgi:hypothetical protein